MPATWQNDLTPIGPADWNYDFAAHLLERAGFGGTPDEIANLAKLTPARAVARLVRFEGTDASNLPPFDHSGVHDPGLEPFPPSRPAVTDMAKEKGEALGIKVKPAATAVSSRSWMSSSTGFAPARSKPTASPIGGPTAWWRARALCRKRWRCSGTAISLRTKPRCAITASCSASWSFSRSREPAISGTSPWRWLKIRRCFRSWTPGVNVKGASNENFAREIMELFTMGVGHYTEKDIREAARAFTGWNYVDLKFVVNKDQHDDGEKTFLGKTGHFDGVDVIDIIMEQPATADFIAGKIYRFFVRQQLSPELQKQLGTVLRDVQLRDQAAA